eukprot:CAMPEP_0182892286 /NCGR_PEP_ID=MMETSP0034_2-20130328/23786_1 /TAXON_ID=156128 /ORGANISM="Nephroselmis pyriformis, Strain CCMP717" /LENGTH=212 /DNA_ID=CAMNT_0025025959 /DNA_START=85 /DNA_END=720 /DNA_ORIENTATION=+
MSGVERVMLENKRLRPFVGPVKASFADDWDFLAAYVHPSDPARADALRQDLQAYIKEASGVLLPAGTLRILLSHIPADLLESAGATPSSTPQKGGGLSSVIAMNESGTFALTALGKKPSLGRPPGEGGAPLADPGLGLPAVGGADVCASRGAAGGGRSRGRGRSKDKGALSRSTPTFESLPRMNRLPNPSASASASATDVGMGEPGGKGSRA